MRPIRVCHVIVGLEVGGAERMLARLATAQSSTTAIEVSVISLTTLGVVGEELRDEGIPVSALGWSGWANLPIMLFKLFREIKRLQPNIVQTWMYHADLFGGFAARLSGVSAVIWGIRASSLPANAPLSTRLARRVCAIVSGFLPDRIICNSESARNTHQRIGYATDRMLIIPNGIEASRFWPPRASAAALRHSWGIKQGEKLVGMVGRDSPDKNPNGFVDAVGRLMRQRIELKAVMLGRGFTPNNRALLERISELGLQHRIVLAGPTRDVPASLGAFDIFVLPSLSESFPNVLAEAMAAGRVCVITDVGDARMILGECGIVVPPNSVEALSAGISMALDLSAEAAGDLGSRARQRVAANYDLKDVVEHFTRAHRDLADKAVRGQS